MRKIYNLFIGVILFNFIACDSYLDKVPDDRTTLDSAEKIKELLTSGYNESNYGAFCYAMTDNAEDQGDKGKYDRENDEAYNWDEFTGVYQDSPSHFWDGSYQAIANINQALTYILENHFNHETNEVDEAFAPYYGEALVARAYAHFMLVNIFAQHYDPNTADKDLGIPYILKPEKKVLVDYKRETVKRTYELIKKDLEEGINYINDNAFEVSKYHLNYAAAYTFASRVYLYMGDWDNVIKCTNKVLSNDVSGQLRDWTGEYQGMQLAEIATNYSKATEKANLFLMSNLSGWFGYFQANNRFGLTHTLQEKMYKDLFVEGTWAPKKSYFKDNVIMKKWGYYFKRNSASSDIGFYYVMFPAIVVEEALFNRAEAYAMLNNTQSALDDVNSYLSKRILERTDNSVATLNNINEFYGDSKVDYTLKPFYENEIKNRALLNCIVDLRRKEFIYNGLRWFDIKRFNLPVVHNFIDGSVKELKSKDLRKAVQIPTSAQQYGIQSNPR